ALYVAIEKYMADTNPLTDAPSRRLLRFALLELHEMQQFGMKCIGALGSPPNMREWITTVLDQLYYAAGGLDGTQPCAGEPSDVSRRVDETRPLTRHGSPGHGSDLPRRYSAT